MGGGGGAGAVLTRRDTVSETGSTNADLLAIAAAGGAEGHWLRAERQRSGRGRQGRTWVSPEGNFYGSTLVRLRPADPPAPSLALVAGIALEQVVRAMLPAGAAQPLLKWPNDLLIGDTKVAGVLLERQGDAVVVGIGVNLAEAPDVPGRATTALRNHDAAVSAESFYPELADAFAEWLGRWRSEGLVPIRARWLERAHPAGTALATSADGQERLTGLFEGLDPSGALLLRLASGERRTVHAGDVFLA